MEEELSQIKFDNLIVVKSVEGKKGKEPYKDNKMFGLQCIS